MSQIVVVNDVQVELLDNGELRYEAGAQIDADGAGNCYAPYHAPLRGLDSVRNAFNQVDDDIDLDGNPVHGWGGGVVKGADGQPLIQASGPYAGFYLSPTALQDHGMPVDDYRRYVDAAQIPYISIPPALEQLGVKLGDAALAADRDTGRSIQCVVADIGPHRRLGEVSIACAAAIGIPANPRNGGAGKGVLVRIFRGSAKAPAWDWRRSAADVAAFVDAFASQA